MVPLVTILVGGKTCSDLMSGAGLELAASAESDCVGRRGSLNLDVNLSRATCPGARSGAAGVGARVAAVVFVLLPGLQQFQHGINSKVGIQRFSVPTSPALPGATDHTALRGGTRFSMQTFSNMLPLGGEELAEMAGPWNASRAPRQQRGDVP